MNKYFYFQPRNFRHSLAEAEGCAPRQSCKPEVKCGVGLAIAVGVAGVAGAAGTAISSSNAADASAAASRNAMYSQALTNNQNKKQWDESRGSTGHAVLPIYMGDFEKNLSNDLISAYNQNNVPVSAYRAAMGRMANSELGAERVANGIFNGGVTREMLDNAAPVEAARLATARSSSLDALHKTLDSIDATQAGRGYVGDSYANRLLSFQAGKSAGDTIGAANQQNLQERADIRNYGDITLPLQNISLPYNLASQAGHQVYLPNEMWYSALGQRMQPFNMLKLGYTGAYQYQPLPTPGPAAYSGNANVLGSLSGGLSGAGGAAMQYYQNQQNMNLLNQASLNNSINSSNQTMYNAMATGTPQMYSFASGAPAGTTTDGLSSFAPSAMPSLYN